MDKIVYIQEDRFQIPEDLMELSHEELQKRIAEECQKELQRKHDEQAILRENNLFTR